MKKICFVMALLCLFSFCAVACSDAGIDDGTVTAGKNEPEAKTEETAERNDSASDSGMSSAAVDSNSVAAQLSGMINAGSADEIAAFVTTPSDDYARQVLSAYPDSDYVVAVKKLGEHEDVIVYTYTIKKKSDADFKREGIELFVRKNGRLLVENNPDVVANFVTDCKCGGCGGSGRVTTGGTACATCGGTGQVYMPNVYFDPTLNMWQGQWQACGGCGGAGMLGATSSACTACGGRGFVV